MLRRPLYTLLTLGVASLLMAGCAAIQTLRADVSTFGEWPAGRAPGSYAFERLPSQQSMPAEQAALEAAAAAAMAKAGFQPVAAGAQPDVLVQVGRHVSTSGPTPWDDPLWWRGSFGYWRYGPWPGPRWGIGFNYTSPRYDVEVAVLLRDRATGKPLYEAHASVDSFGAGGPDMLDALFRAALTDFPYSGINPRKVVVTMGADAQAAPPESK